LEQTVKVSPPFRIVLAGSIGVEAALIFYAWRTGFLLLVSSGIVLIPVLILFQTSIVWLLNWFRIRPEKVSFVQKGFWLLAGVVITCVGGIEGTPRGAFRRLVTAPIPPSVRDIQWNGMALLNGRFVISFHAAPEDVFQILQHRGFSQDTNSWFYGYPNAAEDVASRGENVNRVLSAQCRALKVPIEPLKDPEVFKQKDRDWEKSQGMYLITDRERRKVYVILRWG
jgi:hypothetical protein